MDNMPGPPPVYGVFVDDVNQASAARVVNGITLATNSGARRLHIMFQSWGGFVGDAVMLYNFFRALDGSGVELTLYNSGHVASAGVTAFLGARRRVASQRAMFMMHRSGVTSTGASGPTLENQAKMIAMEDARSLSIWRDNLRMPEERWDHLMQRELFFTGEEAVTYGLATEVGEFAPPQGAQVYKV